MGSSQSAEVAFTVSAVRHQVSDHKALRLGDNSGGTGGEAHEQEEKNVTPQVPDERRDDWRRVRVRTETRTRAWICSAERHAEYCGHWGRGGGGGQAST